MANTTTILGAALIAATLAVATAGQAQDLTIGLASEATSIDPHFADLAANNEVRAHIFDALVERGPRQELVPGLAESWGPTADPTVWEFKLRRGVKFHDGAAFTAADVKFSLDRAPAVPQAPSTFARLLREVAETIVVDEHTVRIRTKAPYALLPNNLTSIAIVSRRIGMEATPASFNTGPSTIGTGPYRFVEFVPGDRITLAANADYWGPRPQWNKVVLRKMTNSASRVAALLTGEIDVIAAVPTVAIERLEKEGKVSLTKGVSNRIIFWAVDLSREVTPHITGKDGREIKNPLRDLRVRQAMDLVIDRQAIVERVMEGIAVAAYQTAPEGFGGYNPKLTIPKADIAAARKLMAEAGYPDGFKMTIHTTNDRYVNDTKLAQTVAQMLARIGIEVSVTGLPVAVYFGPAREQAFTMNLVGWGNITGESSVVLVSALNSKSRDNYGRWNNPTFDGLLAAASQELDTPKREAMLRQAIEIAMADVAILPTHFQVNVWAARKGLRVAPRTDELTLAMSVTRE